MSASSSDTETSACSSKFDPVKALYSDKVKLPVAGAPLYENIQQFESAIEKQQDIIPVGYGHLVKLREDEKQRKISEEIKLLEDKNKQRFAKYEALLPKKKDRTFRNVLTRIEHIKGPLAALKECVEQRVRVKIMTRNATGIRGELQANVIAFDKQWNLALTDVLEVWKRKGPRKRKVPPGLGTPVAKGTAAGVSPIPEITEKPLGGGIWECARHIPQLMVRGEHIVLINIIHR